MTVPSAVSRQPSAVLYNPRTNAWQELAGSTVVGAAFCIDPGTG